MAYPRLFVARICHFTTERLCCHLGFFQEYTLDNRKLSYWLPWGGLARPDTVLNKDNSMISVFRYQTLLPHEDAAKDIAQLCDLVLGFTSGWALYAEVQGDESQDSPTIYYVTLLWSPVVVKGVFVNVPPLFAAKKADAPLDIFSAVVRRLRSLLTPFCDIALLEGKELLYFLHSTISPTPSATFLPPCRHLYLDVALSQGLIIDANQPIPLVNGYQFKIVTPLGLLDTSTIDAILAHLATMQVAFRYVTRFLFFSQQDAQKEEERYMKLWCKQRSSMLRLLEYGSLDRCCCGFYLTSIVLCGKDRALLMAQCRQVEALIQNLGVPAFIESVSDVNECLSNVKDAWFGSIPGMFRAHMTPPLMRVTDPSSLILFPSAIREVGGDARV